MTESEQRWSSVVAFAGGVGGARLVDGLDQVLEDDALTVVVNTGDDFEHWGLRISPDLDTIVYTLAGLSPVERGWGIEGDTFEVLKEARRRGGNEWFQLGDRDLATHLFRTRALADGQSLTEVTQALCQQLSVTRSVLPMSDQPSPTEVTTADGRVLAFQQWLVRERAEAELSRVVSRGRPRVTRQVREALETAELLVLCPSNPYVSIDPILNVQGIREAIGGTPVVAVSPILGGKAVKGPLASMLPALEGRTASARNVALHYGELLDGMLVHHGDAFDAGYPVLETNILIADRDSRKTLASELLAFAWTLR